MPLSFVRKIIDISLPLNQETISYPGNPKVEIDPIQTSGGSYISKLSLGSHTGTHIDTPRHVFLAGKDVDDIGLSLFIGLCRVLDLTAANESISRADLEAKKIKPGERILLKTKNSINGYEQFIDNYVYLAPAAAKYLAELEIMLLGFDYLSVKQRGNPDNTAHTALLSQNIPILEGINLAYVNEGEYFLVVLPLKLMELDGAPARAVLLQ